MVYSFRLQLGGPIMETKIMLAAALFLAGFLWVYLIIRQFLFNLTIAYPTLKKMKAIKEDLIGIGAWRYTHISMVVCILVSAVVLFVVIRFCPTYLLIAFGVGSLICFLMLVLKIKPQNKAMFDNFCTAYCRFVQDDELRNLMFEKEYKKILLKWDFLLPDGLSLQTFYRMANIFWVIKSERVWLPNLNWTDFTPHFLDYTKQKYWNQRINILLYGSKPNVVEKVKENLTLKWYNVIYMQDWFSEFDRSKAEEALNEYVDTINILLVARSTPKIPLQELWTSRNYQKIQDNKLLVMNVWWLFDFIAWVQKRAPKIFRKLKLERLYRFITDPKRNWQKIKNNIPAPWYVLKYLILKKD